MISDYDIKVRDRYPLQSERVYPMTGTYDEAVALANTKHKRTHRATRVCQRNGANTLYRVALGIGMHFNYGAK